MKFPAKEAALLKLWQKQTTLEQQEEFVVLAVARGKINALKLLYKQTPLPEALKAAGANTDEFPQFFKEITHSDDVELLQLIHDKSPDFYDALWTNSKNSHNRLLVEHIVDKKALRLLEYIAQLHPEEDLYAIHRGYGLTWLHLMAIRGWTEGIAYVCQLYPEALYSRENRGRSLLHCATRYGRPKLMMWLMDAGLDVDIGDKKNRTPLYHLLLGYLESLGYAKDLPNWQQCAQILIERGTNEHQYTGKTNRSTPFMSLLKQHQPEKYAILKAMFDAKADQKELQQSTNTVSKEVVIRRI